MSQESYQVRKRLQVITAVIKSTLNSLRVVIYAYLVREDSYTSAPILIILCTGALRTTAGY